MPLTTVSSVVIQVGGWGWLQLKLGEKGRGEQQDYIVGIYLSLLPVRPRLLNSKTAILQAMQQS